MCLHLLHWPVVNADGILEMLGISICTFLCIRRALNLCKVGNYKQYNMVQTIERRCTLCLEGSAAVLQERLWDGARGDSKEFGGGWVRLSLLRCAAAAAKRDFLSMLCGSGHAQRWRPTTGLCLQAGSESSAASWAPWLSHSLMCPAPLVDDPVLARSSLHSIATMHDGTCQLHAWCHPSSACFSHTGSSRISLPGDMCHLEAHHASMLLSSADANMHVCCAGSGL